MRVSGRCSSPAKAINGYLEDCGLRPPPGRGLGSAYDLAGLVPCVKQVTVQGERRRVVALRDGDVLKDASSDFLLAVLLEPVPDD